MTADRNRDIYERHRNGESYRKLAEAYGISKTRIAQIVVREDKRRPRVPTYSNRALTQYPYDTPASLFIVPSVVDWAKKVRRTDTPLLVLMKERE